MSLFLVLPIFGVIQTGAYRGGWHLDISYNGRIILLVVLLYVVPTEYTDHTEAYGLKLFESTEWPTLREARIHRNECLLVCVQAKEIQVQEPCAAIDGNHA